MPKKSKCCQKQSSSSSLSSCSSFSSSSSRSSSYGYCCPKYPKCNNSCYVNKCAPIYYPNNNIGQYPCNPYRPICPPPCPPTTQCAPFYNSYNTIIAGTSISFNLLSAYTLFIVNPTDTSGNLYLPPISSLSSCCYNKMFVISNVSATNTITLNSSTTTTTTDSINGSNQAIISPNSSVNIYSSFIAGVGYWSLVQN
jgi:hypothetical protein